MCRLRTESNWHSVQLKSSMTSLRVPQALSVTLQCPFKLAVHARSASFAGWRAIRRINDSAINSSSTGRSLSPPLRHRPDRHYLTSSFSSSPCSVSTPIAPAIAPHAAAAAAAALAICVFVHVVGRVLSAELFISNDCLY